ncbi:hypothetical protein M0657_000847 [Pyricularia oryzae]|nr:hypothetical protein M9X92_000850 [Pyricularia oryzae]KAI7932122.1 hypothetical protein M0657_000847 [Pyricularia oryzae]
MASQQQNERSNNDRLALAQLPLDTVMSGYTHYELNENLEIEKWHRPAALAAPAPGTLLPPSPEENIERSLELRARWEEQPEVPTDKGYLEPSDLDWPAKLPSRAQLARMAQRRPRPRPSTTAAKARERGGAVRPEPVFWGNGLRRVTLGKDYKASRMIKAILDGARANGKARALRGPRR